VNTRLTTIVPVFGLPFLLAASMVADAWTGALPQGGELRVDPDTRRAWRVEGDQAMPMWDGVHRLENGSIVIIRGGTAVPNEEMLRAWESGPPPMDPLDGRPCEQLERRVCGHGDECRASGACLNARRLLNLERDAQRRAPFGAGPQPETPVAGQCRTALTDPAFPPCDKVPTAGTHTPCHALVERVCGSDERCAASPACPPARQLLEQEGREHAGDPRPDSLTPSGAQCQEAMTNAFFAPCD
jgi:hypothetical protein